MLSQPVEKEWCSKCGCLSDRLTSVAGDGQVKPGIIILCAYCVHPQILGEDLKRRSLTDAEWQRIQENAGARIFIQEFRRCLIANRKEAARWN